MEKKYSNLVKTLFRKPESAYSDDEYSNSSSSSNSNSHHDDKQSQPEHPSNISSIGLRNSIREHGTTASAPDQTESFKPQSLQSLNSFFDLPWTESNNMSRHGDKTYMKTEDAAKPSKPDAKVTKTQNGVVTHKAINQIYQKNRQHHSSQLILQSILQHLCSLYEPDDPKRRHALFISICSSLQKMHLMEPTFQLDQLAALRAHYAHAFVRLVKMAQGNLNRSSVGGSCQQQTICHKYKN